MDFIGKRNIWFAISGVLILVGVISLLGPGLNLGIDFTGGTLLERGFERPITAAQIRQVLNDAELKDIDLGKIVVQPLEGEKAAIIRLPALTNDQIQVVDKVLTDAFGKVETRRTEMVGPVIGRELINQALWALLLAAIGILIYVSFRFEYRFGVAAIVAALHDVIVVLGLFALLGREVNSPFVAAILTVVGYSINDTIVVFDKIRENIGFRKRESWADVANKSINQTLARSINTSVTTLLVVIALYLFGGSTIKDFVLTLFLGIIVGTYSSIFIASPLWVLWRNWDERRKAAAARS